jgi:hypothetical protein
MLWAVHTLNVGFGGRCAPGHQEFPNRPREGNEGEEGSGTIRKEIKEIAEDV